MFLKRQQTPLISSCDFPTVIPFTNRFCHFKISKKETLLRNSESFESNMAVDYENKPHRSLIVVGAKRFVDRTESNCIILNTHLHVSESSYRDSTWLVPLTFLLKTKERSHSRVRRSLCSASRHVAPSRVERSTGGSSLGGHFHSCCPDRPGVSTVTKKKPRTLIAVRHTCRFNYSRIGGDPLSGIIETSTKSASSR